MNKIKTIVAAIVLGLFVTACAGTPKEAPFPLGFEEGIVHPSAESDNAFFGYKK